METRPDIQSAAHRALHIPELLELTLVHLPMSDLLLRAPLVNRAFHKAIASSVHIQQNLFFLPSTDFTSSKPNPVIRHGPHGTVAIMFNDARVPQPLKEGCSFGGRYKWPNSEIGPMIRRGNSEADSEKERKRRVAFGRQDASWRKMLIVQPPIKRLSLRPRGLCSWNSDEWVRMEVLEMYLRNDIVKFNIWSQELGGLMRWWLLGTIKAFPRLEFACCSAPVKHYA
jgi:hypothetical protein